MKLADFMVISIGVLLNALAQLGLKAATRASGPMRIGEPGVWQQMLQVLGVPALWWALAAYGLSVVVWVFALSRVPVGQAYPLLSMGYIVNIALAWWLIGEVPNLQRVVGVSVIVVGVVLVARS
jgi:Predicted membrane protein